MNTRAVLQRRRRASTGSRQEVTSRIHEDVDDNQGEDEATEIPRPDAESIGSPVERLGATPTSIFSPAVGLKTLKLNIEKYDGKREAAAISLFLIGLEDLLVLNGIDITASEQHTQNIAIRIARYYLSGRAQQWFDEIRQELRTWEQFKQELKEEFIPATELEKLGQAFYRAAQTQGGRTRPVGELATELKRIRNLMPESSISLYTLNQRFLDGMDPDLRARLRPMIDLQGPFRENQKLAERYDSAMFAERQEHKRRPTAAQVRPTHHQPTGLARVTSSPIHTPRGQTSGSPPAGGRVSDEERERRRREGLCFYCGDPGHAANFHNSRSHGHSGGSFSPRPSTMKTHGPRTPRLSRIYMGSNEGGAGPANLQVHAFEGKDRIDKKQNRKDKTENKEKNVGSNFENKKKEQMKFEGGSVKESIVHGSEERKVEGEKCLGKGVAAASERVEQVEYDGVGKDMTQEETQLLSQKTHRNIKNEKNEDEVGEKGEIPNKAVTRKQEKRDDSKDSGNGAMQRKLTKVKHPAASPTLDDQTVTPLHHDPPRYRLKISGYEAIVGLDTECTTILLNTKFAHLHNLPYTRSEHVLRLGVQGAKGTIKGLHRAKVEAEGVDLGVFDFALANLPDVDAYIGQPILKAWGATIDCEAREAFLRGPNVVLREDRLAALTVAAITIGEPVAEMSPSELEMKRVRIPLAEKETEGRWFDDRRRELQEEYKDVLVDKIPEDWVPPLREGMNHEIPIIDETKKYPSRPLRIPQAYEEQVRAHWKAMVQAGTAIPAPSDRQSSPLFTVPKKDSTRCREVYDLRARNDNTRKEQIMLPHRQEILSKLAGAKYVSKFDMPDCFLQFRVKPGDIKHTTVATPFGQYRMTLMQMGDTNAPATCQRAMGIIAEGLQGKEVMMFVDDGWLATKGTKEEHLQLIRELLNRFRKHKFLISKKKSGFFMDQVNVLGELRDNVNGLRVPEAGKIKVILDFPSPKNATEVSQFLGMYNFITSYSGTQGPLIGSNITPLAAHQKRSGKKQLGKQHENDALTGYLDSRGKFQWTPRHQQAFEKMKAALACHPYLKDFVGDQSLVDTYVLVDSCLVGTGGCVAQVIKGQPWYLAKPTRYFSKAFNAAQKNYAVHEQETLGLFLFLKDNELELRGRKFTVLTDNDCLMRLKTRPLDLMSPREIRMLQYLETFEMEIRHIPGQSNVVADAISRISNNAAYGSPEMYGQVDENEDGEEVNKLALASAAIRTESAGSHSFETTIRNGLKSDDFTSTIMRDLSKYRNFEVDATGLLWLKGQSTEQKRRLVIPRSTLVGKETAASMVIEHVHQSLAHLGARTVLNQVRKDYYWPRLSQDVIEVCARCASCQQAKVATTQQEPPIRSLEIPLASETWKHIALDFIGPLPEVKHPTYEDTVNCILVVLDRLTSYTICIPCRTSVTALQTAQLLHTYVHPLHGLPDSMVSDRDTRFTSEVWQAICALLKIDTRMSTAYHPRTDGQVERTNRMTIELLRALVQDEATKWAVNLPQVNFALNARVLATCGRSPHHLMYGFKARVPRLVTLDHGEVKAEPDWSSRDSVLNKIREDAREDIFNSRLTRDLIANKIRGEEPSIKTGDMVLLSTKNLKRKEGDTKLHAKYIGPFPVVACHKEYSTYKLGLPKSYRMHNVFHSSQLRRCKERSRNFWKVPVIAPTENEFEVEAIRGERTKGKRREYLVKWRGYPEKENTWEPMGNVRNVEIWRNYMNEK